VEQAQVQGAEDPVQVLEAEIMGTGSIRVQVLGDVAPVALEDSHQIKILAVLNL
jgi:hypothetical protein